MGNNTLLMQKVLKWDGQCSHFHIPLAIYWLLCEIKSLNSSHRMQGYSVSPLYTDKQCRINKTANDVAINHTETPKLPCLQDKLNSHAEKYVYHTVNNFELELNTGIK